MRFASVIPLASRLERTVLHPVVWRPQSVAPRALHPSLSPFPPLLLPSPPLSTSTLTLDSPLLSFNTLHSEQRLAVHTCFSRRRHADNPHVPPAPDLSRPPLPALRFLFSSISTLPTLAHHGPRTSRPLRRSAPPPGRHESRNPQRDPGVSVGRRQGEPSCVEGDVTNGDELRRSVGAALRGHCFVALQEGEHRQ